MKVYSLEFINTADGVGERLWHTNRRALERYSSTLERHGCRVVGIRAFDLPAPLTDTRMVAFLNAHCADCVPRESREDEPPRPEQARDQRLRELG